MYQDVAKFQLSSCGWGQGRGKEMTFWGWVGWDESIVTAERQAQDCCASKKERKEKPKITKHQQKVISQTVD